MTTRAQRSPLDSQGRLLGDTTVTETRQSERSMMEEAEFVLVIAVSPLWYPGHCGHSKYMH